MIRSSRLMATMLAAVFAAVLATPAYATYSTSTCAARTARTYGTGCKAEGTKFNDLDADGKRDAGEPGLASWRIWADYDNDGVLDSRRAVRRHRRERPLHDRRHQADEQQQDAHVHAPAKKYRLREKRPGGGTGGWTCSYPNASTSGGFANGTGGDFKCGHGPIDVSTDPKVTGKDFGNYKKPKITVIKKLVPATDSGRFDLKVDGATVKAAAGDGGSGSTYVTVGAHQVTETGGERHQPRRLHGLDRLQDDHGCAHVRPGLGPRQAGRRRHLHDHEHAQGQGRDRQADRAGTRRGGTPSASPASPAPSASPTAAMKTITGVLPRSEPYAVTESNAAGYRLKSITCNDGDSTGAVGTRTASIRVAAGETVRCTFVNTKLSAAIEVVKSGPAQVHHGDKMDFSFAVRNVGNSPLHDIKVTDNRCAPVSATPVSKTGGDSDDVLEDGEVWTYTCTKTVPDARPGEADPLCNVATATGDDEQDKPVTDTDEHCTDIVHPAINVKKTPNRTTATVGDTIGYTLRRHQPR